MAIDLTGIVDWLKGWFYDKSEVNTYLNAKANKNLTNANMNVVTDSSGNITTEAKPTIPDVSGKIDTAGTGLSKTGTTLNHSNSIAAQNSAVLKKIKYDAQGHITGTANVGENDLPMHAHSSDLIVDTTSNNYGNIGITTLGATQQAINTAINTAIGNLSSIKAVEVVTTRPTASASTMGKLYILSESGKVNVYYTKQSGSNYSWQKMDSDILDELSISWSDVTGKPFSTVDSSLSSSSTNPVQNKAINTALSSKANSLHTHTISNSTNATDNIYVPNGADYTAVKNTTGNAVPLDLMLQMFGLYMKNLNDNRISSIALVPKSSDNTGAIRLYYGDEPS